MAIEKMNLVRVSTSKDNVMNMLESIHDYKWFHPELSKDVISEVDDVGLVFDHEQVYHQYNERFIKALSALDLVLNKKCDRRYSFEDMDRVLTELEKKVILVKDVQPLFSELESEDGKALEVLCQYPLNDISDGFISVVFGKVSQTKFQTISQYHQETFLYSVLYRNKKAVWLLVLFLKKDNLHFNEILDDLDFITLPISEKLAVGLDDAFLLELEHIYGFVYDQLEIESYFPFVSIYDQMGVIAGFVKSDKVAEFMGLFDDTVKVNVFEGMAHETLMPPTLLNNNCFSRPFELLVKMYGLPQYNAYDPTFFFSLSYSVLFGIMFGDVGQGFVISLIGYFIYRLKKMELGAIMFRIGWFSMFFGFVFGSLFGNETILEPLLHPLGLPIHVTSNDFTMTLLISAVAMGVFLILNAIVINIMTGLKNKDFEKAFLTQNGLAGFVFYGFVIVAIVMEVSGISILNPISISVGIALPLLIIFMKHPIMSYLKKEPLKPFGGWGNYLVESFFELFEVLLGFVSNTLSFMRVGGFVLSHAGMMSVVMTLNQMSGSASLLVLILGNILVIGLEGLIVGIQTLRLQYYEIFSRFYDAGGKPFKSIN